MLQVKWIKGESEGYTDILPDWVLSFASPTVLVHNIIGRNGARYLAKCAVHKTSDTVNFDYCPYAELNTRSGIPLGVMRVTMREGWPDKKVFWQTQGDERFEDGEAEADYSPGVP